MVSSIFSSKRTILVLSDGAQGALNLDVTPFFFLQKVVWWWVYSFFTKLLISGYFVSTGKAHAMYLSIHFTTSCPLFHHILEHLMGDDCSTVPQKLMSSFWGGSPNLGRPRLGLECPDVSSFQSHDDQIKVKPFYPKHICWWII